MTIHTKYATQLTTQKYGDKINIEGVEILPLALQTDDGGNFSEIVRLTDGKVTTPQLQTPFEPKQISTSLMTPGTIKGYHIHQNQDDIWYVPMCERLIVNLHDLREDSKTFDTHVRLVLGGGKNFLLYIPKGVAHGVANKYDRNMLLFYLTNQQFNLENPDELRLPWDAFGADVWEITKG